MTYEKLKLDYRQFKSLADVLEVVSLRPFNKSIEQCMKDAKMEEVLSGLKIPAGEYTSSKSAADLSSKVIPFSQQKKTTDYVVRREHVSNYQRG